MNGMTTFGYNSNGSINITSPLSPHAQDYSTSVGHNSRTYTKTYDDGFPVGMFALLVLMAFIVFGAFLSWNS